MKYIVENIFKDKYMKLITVSFIAVTITTVAVYLCDPHDIKWLRMIWNYFLAAIPLVAAVISEYYYDRDRIPPAVVCGLIWLLFFPNTMYMLTDFKYCASFNFEVWSIYYSLEENIYVWVLLVNLVVSIFAGVLAGVMSLEIIHNMLKDKFKPSICWIIITGISILSSFGVYIGRFARLNSWDIIFWEKLFDDTIKVMTPFAPIFIGIFTILTLVLYIGYKFLKGIIKET